MMMEMVTVKLSCIVCQNVIVHQDDGDGHRKVVMHCVSENVIVHQDGGDGHRKVVMHCVSENVIVHQDDGHNEVMMRE